MSLRAEFLAFDRAPPPLAFDPVYAEELIAFDRGTLRTYDLDGRMHVESCNISKSVVNPYFGREIPGWQALGLDPNRTYKLYRDPAELAKAAPTFANLQLLDLHTPVSASDPKMDRTAGCLGSDVRFEAPHLKASIAVWTKAAIDAIRSRQKAELSASYRYRADMTPGVTPQGVAYDGVMRDIIGNHVALVKEGRAGSDVCVSDSLPLEFSEMKFKFPNLIEVIASIIPALSNDQKLALDQAFDARAKDEGKEDRDEAYDMREEACDSRESAMDAAEEESDKDKADDKAKDRKTARDSRKAARDKRAHDRKVARDKRAKDKKARDTDPVLAEKEKELKGGAEDAQRAVDAALRTGEVISAADARKMADDARKAAVSEVNAIAQAREEVKPLVGVITAAMDSAQAVYTFALDQAKVAHAGVNETAALAALVAAEVRARRAAPKSFASDSAASGHSLKTIFKKTA